MTNKKTETCEKIGKNEDVPFEYFRKNELDMGIKVEMEHTDDTDIALRIAKDHLAEFPDYYTRLTKMEKTAKKFWSKEKNW